MILTLCVWLLLSLIFVEAGRIALGSKAQSFVLTWLTGFSAVTLLAQFLSILMPMGDIFLPAVTLSLLLTYFFRKGDKAKEARTFYQNRFNELKSLNRIRLLALIAGSLFILYKSSVVPHNYDTGLYHAQSIQWIEKFPVVPGLANLDARQGFNSAWFVASAYSSLSFTGTSFHLLNGLLYLIAFLLGFKSISRIAAGNYKSYDLVALAAPFCFFIFAKNLSSPSPDLPATLFCIFTLYYFISDEAEHDNTLIVVLLAAMAVVIKLSVLFIVLLPFMLLFKKIRVKEYRPVRESIMIILLAVGPWLARNVILSGYFIFPAAGTDFITTDWKVPAEKTESLSRTISAWARIPAVPAEEVLAMSYMEWIPRWWNTSAVVMPYDKLFLLLFLVSVIWRLFRFIRTRTMTYADTAFFICATGVFAWFITAPDFRFVYGFILPALMLGLREMLSWIFTKIKSLMNPARVLYPALLILMVGTVYMYSRVFIKDAPLSSLLVHPESYPQPARIQTVTLQNQNIHIIFDPDCQRWSAPIPAICDISVLEQLQFRGRNLNNGFRTRSKE